MEHSTISFEQAKHIIAASQGNGIPCLPRPVSHSNDVFKPLLDSGSDGFLISTVDTSEHVRNIINILKYPPTGKRTYGLNRAQDYGFGSEQYFKKWNETSSIIIQVESKESVKNINDLLGFDEVDGVMIGPYDLSGSLGVSGQTDHHLVIEASKKVINACKKYGKSCGTQIADVTDSKVNETFDLGYNFAILSSDLFILWKWTENINKIIKSKR